MKTRLWAAGIGFFFLFSLMGLAAGKDPKAPKKTPELVQAGKKLFAQNCASCHGEKGDGKGPIGMALTPHPADFALPLKEWPNTKGDPQKVFEVISKGVPNSAMVGWPQFSGTERWGLVYFVMEFATRRNP